MQLSNIYEFLTGQLPALEITDNGAIPLVYGTTLNNGIVKFVSVESSEQVFMPPKITVSYLGTAFVQVVPFTTSVVDKSNIIILSPKNNISLEEMYFHAYQINRISNFGFHYGRRLNMAKLSKVDLLPLDISIPKIDFAKIIPRLKNNDLQNIPTKKTFIDLTEKFRIHIARSHSIKDYEKGDTAFVSNGMENKGVVGYVKPLKGDKVFDEVCLCVSSFCEATIQMPPFLPRGNGGSGLLVLEPKKEMSNQEMIFYASFINQFHKWRYSYGRMVTKDRLSKMQLLAWDKQ